MAGKFETHLEKLQSIVERLESGEQPLEEALSDFEEGIKLSRACHKELDRAQKKVETLLAKEADDQLDRSEDA